MSSELLSLMAARQGHFLLESGHHGDLWLELDPLFAQPRRLQPFVAELARQLAQYNPEAICGPLSGGAFLAQMIAVELAIDFYYTERVAPVERDALYGVKYHLPARLRPLIQGQAVALVDDVINAGSAVRATLAELQAYGARPVAAGALLVLGEAAPAFFAARQLPLVRLAALPNHLWAPADCPLCAAQVPLEPP